MTARTALVLAGHGSQTHPATAGAVYAQVDRLRDRAVADVVRAGFWKEDPTLRSVASTLACDRAVVVPMLTSGGYFADAVFPRELGVDDATALDCGPTIQYTDPVGTHPAMTTVLADRVEATRDLPPGEVGVVVVGHGTDRHARSDRATREHVRRLRDRDRYAAVASAFLDESPHIADVVPAIAGVELVVVPLFIADGDHTTTDIPAAFGHPGRGERAILDGRPVHYTAAVGTEDRVTDIILDRARDAGLTPTGDGGLTTDEERFVAACASASPVTLGELRLTHRDGSFALRHRADAGGDPADLTSIPDPAALRDNVRTDDAGAYRPVSGLRTLPRGWILDGLDRAGFVRAVRAVYPGAIVHRALDRREALPVTDLPATLDRQIGMYREIDRLDDETLRAATETVCGACVRQPRWGIDGDTSPDDAAGDIPCPEACPAVLETAHRLATNRGDPLPDALAHAQAPDDPTPTAVPPGGGR